MSFKANDGLYGRLYVLSQGKPRREIYHGLRLIQTIIDLNEGILGNDRIHWKVSRGNRFNALDLLG
jgi:hypothetical protein